MDMAKLKTRLLGYDRLAVCRLIQEMEERYYQLTREDRDELAQLREQVKALELERAEALRTLEERAARICALEERVQTLTRLQEEAGDALETEVLPALERAAQLRELLAGQGAHT